MKKRIGILMTLIMLFSLSMTALAEGPTTIGPDASGNPTPGSGDTQVTFNVAPTYTITIPKDVTLEPDTTGGATSYKNDLTVSAAAGVRLLEGKVIKVTLAGDFELKTNAGAYKLPYTVKVGTDTTAIKSGDEVAQFGTNTEAQKSVLHFQAGDPTYAGTYSDEVTFTIAIGDETP